MVPILIGITTHYMYHYMYHYSGYINYRTINLRHITRYTQLLKYLTEKDEKYEQFSQENDEHFDRW